VPKTKDQASSYGEELINRLREMAGDDPSGKLTIDELSHWMDRAETNRRNWQRWYYGGRTTVTIVAAAVTALTGASAGLTGGAGLGIKIAAAVLSFVVAATNGTLEVWQVTNRWRLYRVLRDRLWQAGWTLATAEVPRKFQSLTKEVGTAIGDFEHQYLMQVLLTQPGDQEVNKPNGGKGGEDQPQDDAGENHDGGS
jgi:hypothetical protein